MLRTLSTQGPGHERQQQGCGGAHGCQRPPARAGGAGVGRKGAVGLPVERARVCFVGPGPGQSAGVGGGCGGGGAGSGCMCGWGAGGTAPRRTAAAPSPPTSLAQGFIHRDIKGANILVSDKGEVKLTDFGCSYGACLSSEMCNIPFGTVLWMAPEVWPPPGGADRAGQECIGRGGGGPPPPLQGAQPMPSRCPTDAKCQRQRHS